MWRRWIWLGLLTAVVMALPVGGVGLVVVDTAGAKQHHHKKRHHKKKKHQKAGPCGGNATDAPNNTYDYSFRCKQAFSSFSATVPQHISNATAVEENGPSYTCHTTGPHSFSCTGPNNPPQNQNGGLTQDVFIRVTSADACPFNSPFTWTVTIDGKGSAIPGFCRFRQP